ncbi:unnamed protein product [Nippostrongylus brasiliensis]|uniref:Fukutin (inferred by orthology to a human protein) n=1 Tax=Nippostrongylus brasiliensis TaxID=27835 RepID=A0A0N4YH98_NIPBR|nr:unnamed protein product [Nippostrongylus brasiliensis]
MLHRIQLPYRAILIDLDVLQSIDRSECKEINQRIRLAVDVKDLNTTDKINYNDFEILYYKTDPMKDYLVVYDSPTRIIPSIDRSECKEINQRIRLAVDVKDLNTTDKINYNDFEILYYKTDPMKDYLVVYDSPIRIIPRFPLMAHGNLSVPTNPRRFIEYWKRSKFIPCLGLKMERNLTSSYLPVQKTIQTMSSLMNYVIDVDFGAHIAQYKPELLDDLLKGRTFRLKRKFGRPNDSMEFTILPHSEGRPMMDLFWMYSNANETWVAGTGGDGTKYKYTYPLLNESCAGELYGHIFWVPCRPKDVLEAEYGPKWYLDHPTSQFWWSSSQHNVKKNGKWSKAEMSEVYKVYTLK